MADKPSSAVIAPAKIADFCTETTQTLPPASTPSNLREAIPGDGPVMVARKNESLVDRIKRHREEIGGRVLIPEKWGKEEFLTEWVDYSSFDSLLAPAGVSSARRALAEEGRAEPISPCRNREPWLSFSV